MLFQLNQLKITPDSFRLLYAIMTAAYHDKIWDTTHGILERDSGLSRYKVRAALDELKREKLITAKSSTSGVKITLMPVLVEMIYKDYKRRGASQRTKNMAEIKKSQPPKQEARPTRNCRTSSTQTSTLTPLQNTSKPSLKNTLKKKETLPQAQQSPKQTQTAPQKPLSTKSPSSKQPTSKKLKASDKKPYITTRGTLYKVFEDWLKGYELLSDLDIARLRKNDNKMMYYWKEFQDYARCWLSLNAQIQRPERDLNKIKAMKKIAALAKAS